MRSRREFLTGLGLLAPAVAIPSAATAQAQTVSGSAWAAGRHTQDDWLESIPGRHRLVFDTTTADGFGQSLLYVNNYLGKNKDAYGLNENELAVVIIARHRSTPYALNDAMWAKYGAGLTQLTTLNDPNTKRPPTVNVYNSPAYGTTLLNRGTMLDGLLKRGVHLAVCEIGTLTAASMIAGSTNGDVEAINAELLKNLLPNAHMVPAGIVTINRAQERGYAFAYAAGL